MKKINIPIHKHTPKRYRRSKWVVYMSWFSTDEPADPIYENGSIYPTHPLVTDLTRVPNPTLTDILTPQPIVDIDAILNFEPRSTIFNEIGKSKPSLYKRILRKVKR